jgi:hypothetical protein
MTAPIDIMCPYCAATDGNYCTSDPEGRQRITFHHAERVDAAARLSDRARRHDPDPARLREALREALDMLHAYVEGCNAVDDRQRLAELRQEFDL